MSTVSLIQVIDINIVAVFVLVIILFAASGLREKGLLQYQLFDVLVLAGIGMNLLEILGRVFDQLAGPLAWWLNGISNTLLYCAVPIPAAIWLIYAQYQIFHNVTLLRRTILMLTPLLALNAFLSVLSLRTGWFFVISSDNLYRRGEYFLVHVIIAFGILLTACLLVISNRHLLERRNFWALLIYVLPQFAGSVLQTTVYGLSFNWPFMMLSVLIIFAHVQSRGQYTDTLTGTYNQRHFEQIIRIRINRADEPARFALLLADLDDFRNINETYGRKAGDDALQAAANQIRSCLRKDDLIARIGGDEFYMLLEIEDDEALQGAIRRLYNRFAAFNESGELPFRIEPSICGLLYDPEEGTSAETFLRQVDQLMIKEKDRRLAEALSVGPSVGHEDSD